ncbi:MAG TPA: hypothetical protein VGF25_23545 [Thermoleophilaceae bacterium]|jgi:hypothetical protein
MAGAGTRIDARTALLERLIDHAALFPPASMDMPSALAEDRAARQSPQAWMIGRFVCPASRLGELAEEVPLADAPPLSVVLDGASGATEDDWAQALIDDWAAVADAIARGADAVAAEAYLPSARPAPPTIIAGRRAVACAVAYFELRPEDGWRDALPATIGALAAVGARVKVRCGGAAVPPVDQLALVVASCAQARVRFKATAGLHHPVRAEEHGFLNLLAAAVFAHAHGVGAPALEPVLAETDPGAFEIGPDRIAVCGHEASAAQVGAARAELFDGYGSCSWREPVEGLRELGIL